MAGTFTQFNFLGTNFKVVYYFGHLFAQQETAEILKTTISLCLAVNSLLRLQFENYSPQIQIWGYRLIDDALTCKRLPWRQFCCSGNFTIAQIPEMKETYEWRGTRARIARAAVIRIFQIGLPPHSYTIGKSNVNWEEFEITFHNLL